MIRAELLTKRFGSFTAIENVSFAVEPGEIVGFLGPNGAGKSTTMRILSGVFPPTSGQAFVAGHDVVAESLEARRLVGYFPERVALYFDMTVREYLGYVAAMKFVPRAQRAAAVEQPIAACNLEAVAHRLIGTLSKGYRQRVGIAQALVGDPPVLILDEPTAGLDPEQVADMRDRILGLRGSRTVILSTHILPEVEATCDRVIIIDRGHVLAVDTPANLNRRLRPLSQIHIELRRGGERAADLLRSFDGVRDVRRVANGDPEITTLAIDVDKDRDVRGAIASHLTAAGLELIELRPVNLSLEDIFLNLITERKAGSRSGVAA
jgi:ABC-2 type transport system ATP-binding protein